MLIELRIDGFILVKHAHLHFGEGLNLITGETGSGKTLILKALSALFGEKPATEHIPSRIEAHFETSSLAVKEFLLERGFQWDTSDPLSIKRVVKEDGKVRFYVVDQLAAKETIKELGSYLFCLVDAYAAKELTHSDHMRTLLDHFGKHFAEVAVVKQTWKELQNLEEEKRCLEHVLQKDPQFFEWQLEELSSLPPQREIESLYQKHEAIVYQKEQSELIAGLYQRIDSATLPILESMCHETARAARKHPLISEAFSHLKEATEHVKKALVLLEPNEESSEDFELLDQTIAHIESLKRKYRCTEEQLYQKKELLLADLDAYTKAEQTLQNITKAIEEKDKLLTSAAELLHKKRLLAAPLLAQGITELARSFNLPSFQLEIAIEKRNLSQTGIDLIQWFVSTNPEEPLKPIRQIASSGELARIFLATELILGKDQKTLLLLDEIDANIGGETAALIGEKLHQFSRGRQIIGITHFPQVAMKADHHIAAEKIDGVSQFKVLLGTDRELELQRMLGGKYTTLQLTR